MELIQVGCFEVLEANEWIQLKDLRHVRSFPTTTTGLTEIILCELQHKQDAEAAVLLFDVA
jgi:hypothetical protein